MIKTIGIISQDPALSRMTYDALAEAFEKGGSIMDEIEDSRYYRDGDRFVLVLAELEEEIGFIPIEMTGELFDPELWGRAGSADILISLLECPQDPSIDYSEMSAMLDSALEELETLGKPGIVVLTHIQRLLEGPVLSEEQWQSVLDGLYNCLQNGSAPGNDVFNSLCKVAAWRFRRAKDAIPGTIGFLYTGADSTIRYGRDELIAALLRQLLGTIRGYEFSFHACK